jgi:hypothetical protein
MASFVRNLLIRGVILAAFAALGYGGWLAVHWVSPERVRAAVLDHLHAKFGESVEVTLGAAEMRLFGGLSVTDLTLTRRGEAEPFLHIPHAVLYHDKEKLTRGELAVRKIEFTRPTFRLDRHPDGTWALDPFVQSEPADRSLPTVLTHDATVIVTDRRPGGPPPVAFRHVQLTVLNDPLPAVKIDGQCVAVAAAALDSAGNIPAGVFRVPISLSARLHRGTGHLTAHVETGELDIGPDLAPLLADAHPKAVEYLQQFQGKVTVKADVGLTGDAGPPKYDVRVELRDGRFEDSALLPWPIDRLTGTVRVCDGRLTVEKMTGKLGGAAAELALESKPDLLCPKAAVGRRVPGTPPVGPRLVPVVLAHHLTDSAAPPDPCADPVAAVEDKLDRFELKVLALSLDDDLFARLTPDAQKIKAVFKPTGGVDIAVRFTRPDGGWRREVDVIPQGLGIEYEHFRYAITELTGSVKHVSAGAVAGGQRTQATDEFRVNVTATAGGQRIAITGRVAGGGPDSLVDLTITGAAIPIDAKLIAALPPKYAAELGKLRATARANFDIAVRREPGVNRLETTYKISCYNGQVNYAQFPYPLRQVRGDIHIVINVRDPSRPLRPGLPLTVVPDRDRVELRNFEAVHDGGRLWVSGLSAAVPDTPDRKLTLKVQGQNCPIDADFKAALQAVGAGDLVAALAPRGDLSFGADFEVWERGKKTAPPPPPDQPIATAAFLPAEPPFDPAKDLNVTFHFRGPSVTPAFFPYDLHQLGGVVIYQNGQVKLSDLVARHGAAAIKLGDGEVRFPAGGVWANLGDIQVAPLMVDQQFLKALPADARRGFEQLNVRGAADLTVRHLVISVPGTSVRPVAPDPPVIQQVASLKVVDRLSALVSLPPRAARPQPPDKPLVVTAAGLLPFTLPWQKPSLAVASPGPPTAVQPVVYWDATLKLAGGALDAGVPWEDVYGAIASEGRFEGDHLGPVSGNAWFDRATIAKQPVTTAKVSYRVLPQQPDPAKPGRYLPPVAEFRDLTGAAFGGTVGGEARVMLTDPPRFRLYLTGAELKLEEMARHHKLGSGELSGQAQAKVLLEGGPDPKTGKPTMTGSGQVDVPQGRMYNLPVLLELVKVLKGQTPDGVAFEEAHATFDVKGDRVHVTQLDLLGAAVSLGGSGEVDMCTKDVRFEFYTIWSQTLRRWLATPFGEITGLLSGGLFKIEMTRVNGEMKYQAHMLPAVTDPVRAVAERWRARRGRWESAGQPQPAGATVRAAPR